VPCSAAVTSPRCREGTASSSRRGSAPSTGRPHLGARRAQHLLVPGAADLVEHHAGQPGPGSVGGDGRAAGRPGCGSAPGVSHQPAPGRRAAGPRARGAVGDLIHRLAGISGAAAPIRPSNSPNHAFHHGPVRRRPAPWCEQRRNPVLATSTGSRLRPGAAGGQGVVAGVDVVRADLERRHRGTPPTQRGHQPVATVVLPVPDATPAITIALLILGTLLVRRPAARLGYGERGHLVRENAHSQEGTGNCLIVTDFLDRLQLPPIRRNTARSASCQSDY